MEGGIIFKIIIILRESTRVLSVGGPFFCSSPGRLEVEDYSEMKKGQMFEFAHVLAA